MEKELTMADKIRAIQYGLGPIGSAVAREAVAREGVELVGGVDIDESKVGRDVGEVIGLETPLGFSVMDDLSDVLKRAEPDVALHTTSSYFDLFKPQVIDILEAGLDIISTAEELSFPWLAHPVDASEVDAVAKRVGKTVLGTGVNPGFLMDALPLNLTSICLQVDHISVTRVINASNRRGPFQAKIGSGLTVQDFEKKMADGRMGHVGLPESVGMIFDTLNRQVVGYESGVQPVVAEKPVETEHVAVKAGQVRGLKQVTQAYAEEGEFVSLTFVAALEEDDEGDTIKITGRPNLEVHLQGTNGDIATVAIVVNAIRRVKEAAPGLLTMRDLPIVTHW